MAPETQAQMTLPDALNSFAKLCMADEQFRITCCNHWREFSDGDQIGRDIAEYSRTVFRLIGQEFSDEQARAIGEFPPECLLLLKSFVIQFLGCPKPGPPTLRVNYRADRNPGDPAITITIDGNNNANVVFRAPRVV